ncbi:MAG TPA: SigB/SigF/SigG family RNA polymerase sigma factor [Solirubrobacteraceae bacterium]|nr:SigB/SigF/SigG family RNA polymerase sigma factor [Solirubrobacteraceae bacterium]
MTALATTTAPSHLSSEELFARSSSGDGAAREELIVRFMPLARRLARRYWRSSLPVEDLTQVANLALVKAVDRYDPSRERTFEAFAIPTILGELRRFFRDTSWSVHVTRSAQERSMQVHQAIATLARETGRPPTARQLGEYLELDEEDVLNALFVLQAYKANSLDAPVQADQETTTLGSTLGRADAGYELAEDDMMLERALEILTPREHELLELRFVEELPQAQIGERMGVSQMQISRLLRATLAKLRDQIGEIAEG